MRHSLTAVATATLCACQPQERGVATHVDDWRDEVIYQIVVDRFENGDPQNDTLDGVTTVPGDLRRHQGGDWRGIASRLDYVQALGATTLWISPVVANVDRTDAQDGYHGYWASDFTRPNPRFGSLEDLRHLVDGAHARGLKVIVDVVTNHTGRVFYYDLDGDGRPGEGELEPPFFPDGPADGVTWLTDPPAVYLGDPAAPRRRVLDADHFHRRGQFVTADATERELGDFPTGLRDLDTENDEVVQAMIDTLAWWVAQTDIDGVRLDAVPHVPHAFWARFADGLRRRLAAMGKERFFLVGEVFHGDPAILGGYAAAGLDSVFDFSLKRDLIDGVILDGNAAATATGALESYRSFYPLAPHPGGVGISPWSGRVAFADNHDLPRLRYWLDDPWAAELAVTAVFTVDAIPCVYYGTEQELDGGWHDASREVLWDTGFDRSKRMYRHIARLAEIRRASPALRRGELRVRHASPTPGRERAADAGLLAWERWLDGDRVLVSLNAHPADIAQAQVPTGFPPGTRLCDRLARRDCVTVDATGAVLLRIPPRVAWILMPEGGAK